VPEVPFASEENAVRLVLANQVADSVASVYVNLTEKPSWVRLQPRQMSLSGLPEGTERPVRFGFSVTEDAPVGTPTALRFTITAAGDTIGRETVRFRVGAPAELELKGNAPNPFREQTRIRYTLPEPANVTVRVYDLLGRRVARLKQGRRQTGLQTIQWTPKNVASGTYFYRVKATPPNGDPLIADGRMTIVR